MKILVICQYYYPEPFRIADICEEMVNRGHDVTVVTGVPNYPEGITYQGYENGQKSYEVINGVKVYRCFTIPRKTGAVYRLLNYYSYAISSTRFVKKHIDSDFDVVYVNQLSPVMMGKAGIAYSKKYKVPTVMYCLDLWPESLIAGGIGRDSIIYKFFHRESKKIYSNMDEILITSKLFSNYLSKEFAIDKNKIKYLPQYAEGIFETLSVKKNNNYFDFMFAGNIGAVQSVDTILKTAKILKKDYSNVRFHIVGGGTDLENLKRFAKDNELDNVIFYGRKPLNEMPKYYAMADAMLVTLQGNPVLSLTLPGKVQSYMAVGKPIIGAINGETSQIINEAHCGYCGNAEDSDELAENIKKFISNENRTSMGANARDYYEKHFQQKMFMDKLENELANIELS
jgi:glycosyltransferase involved in cell wall biosynthesis